MRTCTDTTKRQIAAQRYFRPHPAWLRAAVNDALHDKPMSLARERRMCIALWIEPPTRRPYWRPCLPVTLTPQQRATVVDYAASLAGQAGEGGV